jgi:hypothetical protein
MRNLKILFLLVVCLISLHTKAQNAAQTVVNTRDSNPFKKYLRPSLTVIYVNRGNGENADRMQKVFETVQIPDKFNDNNVQTRTIKANPSSISFATEMEQILTKEVSREVVAKWFNRNANGEFSMDVIAERGMYNASDADVIKAQASKRKMSLIKDAGENLLDRSYILLYDIRNIKKVNASDMFGNPKEGYECEFDCYLYRLDWNEEIANNFYTNLWVDASSKNPDKVKAFEAATFPVKFIAKTDNVFGIVQSMQSATANQISDDQLFANLYNEINTIANVSLSKKCEDFRVKAPIYSTGPVTAKIGLKEGLTVDKRFFAYEMQMKDNGERKFVRKGVVRATNKICDNRTIATGKSETSQFYQVAGLRLSEGMQLQENPDWGIGVMGGWGALPGIGSGLNLTLELNASMWGAKALSENQGGVPPGIKLYGNLYKPLETISANGEKYNILGYNGGISKDLNFLNQFVLIPFIGAGVESYTNDDDPKNDYYNGVVFQIGSRLGINILHNIQLVGNINFNALLYGTYDENAKKEKLDNGDDNPNFNSKYKGDQTKANAIVKARGSNPQFSVGLRYQF